MTDQTVKKKLLPIMVAFSCLVGLPVCITPLVMGLYNPRPFEPYCYIGSYPYRCNRDPILDREKGVSCIRGDVPAATEDKVFLVTMIGIGVGFFLMVVSLVMVVMSVFQTEMAVRRVLKEEGIEDENENGNQTILYSSNVLAENANDTPLGNTATRTTTSSSTRNRRGRRRIMDDFQETRTILRIALMYIGAFFLTWIWTIITMTVYINNSTVRSILDYSKLIFNPSQGTFNALIFIYNRVHIARQVKPNLTFSQALQMVLFTPSIVPEILVSSLDVVENDRNQREEDARIRELIDVEDEQQGEGDVEISAVSPVSLPSNFLSLDTPSFALSDVVSSHGIDTELEKRNKRDGDPNDTRQFYADTPKEYLDFRGNTLDAAWKLEGMSGVSLATPPTISRDRCPITGIAHPGSNASKMSGASSKFLLKSLLSGFSVASIKEEDEDKDKEDDEEVGVGKKSNEESFCDDLSFNSKNA